MIDIKAINGAIAAIDASGDSVNAVMSNRVLREVLEELKAFKSIGLTPEQIREVDRLYAEKCREVARLKK